MQVFFTNPTKGGKNFAGAKFGINVSPGADNIWTTSPVNSSNISVMRENFDTIVHRISLVKIYEMICLLHLN